MNVKVMLLSAVMSYSGSLLAEVEFGADLAPEKVVGWEECAECHVQEAQAWKASGHYRSADRYFQSPEATQKYIEALDIPRDSLRKDSMCDSCHATKAQDPWSGRATARVGVSCGSCHGNAGGDPGWLNPHSSYGYSHTLGRSLRIDEETTEHYEQRIAASERDGWIRPERAYQMVKACAQCHLAVPPKLAAAGHKASLQSFEFVSWFSGEARHNFHVDQSVNAESPSNWHYRNPGVSVAQRRGLEFVTGVMVDLEVNLRNIARGLEQGSGAVVVLSRVRAEEKLNLLFDFVFEYEDAGVDVPDVFVNAMLLADSLDLRSSDASKYASAATDMSMIAQSFELQSQSIDLSVLSLIFDDEIGAPKGEPFHPRR